MARASRRTRRRRAMGTRRRRPALSFQLRQFPRRPRGQTEDPSASLDDLNEAVTRLEDLDRTGRRVLGGANPFTEGVGRELLQARAALRARETPSETPGSFQRASEEKLRTRRVVSVADRFRRPAAKTPGGDDSRSTDL